jgi:hypothetical protein
MIVIKKTSGPSIAVESETFIGRQKKPLDLEQQVERIFPLAIPLTILCPSPRLVFRLADNRLLTPDLSSLARPGIAGITV